MTIDRCSIFKGLEKAVRRYVAMTNGQHIRSGDRSESQIQSFLAEEIYLSSRGCSKPLYTTCEWTFLQILNHMKCSVDIFQNLHSRPDIIVFDSDDKIVSVIELKLFDWLWDDHDKLVTFYRCLQGLPTAPTMYAVSISLNDNPAFVSKNGKDVYKSDPVIMEGVESERGKMHFLHMFVAEVGN